MKKTVAYLLSSFSLAPIVIPLLLMIRAHVYDYLMPFELLAFVIAGGFGTAIIGWISKASVKKLVVISSLPILNFIAAQIYANLSGLAHGEAKLSGIRVIFVALFVVLQHALVVWVFVESLMLVKRL